MRLLPNLYQIAGPHTRPGESAAYLLTGPRPVVIDCGTPEGFPALCRNLERVGTPLDRIELLIATHGHAHNLGAAALFIRESEAQLLLHPGDRQHEQETASAFPSDLPACEDLQEGEEIPAGYGVIRVLHTPGHTPGSVTLLADVAGMRLLFLGDMLWGDGDASSGSDLAAWRRSLEMLSRHDFDAVLPCDNPLVLYADGLRRLTESLETLRQGHLPRPRQLPL